MSTYWRIQLPCVWLIGLLLANGLCSVARAGKEDGKLDFYFIDVEGGAATLVVTPAGESILVDTGNPGDRDAGRIFDAAKAAGLTKLNIVVITHYHGDHFGGLAKLATLIPIEHLYDNGNENPTADRPTPAYLQAEVGDRKLMNPGDQLPLAQRAGGPALSIQCLAAHRKLIDAHVGAKSNPLAEGARMKGEDRSDNANSIVLLLRFGDFKFYDGGDLTWNIEHDLAAPINRIGTVDVYQVTHHGLAQSNNPVLVKAVEPTVAIMNNGATKGCEPEVFATLTSTPTIQAVFQLHKNLRPDGATNNVDPKYIANLERNCEGNRIQMSVSADAKAYIVSIPATKFEQSFETKAETQPSDIPEPTARTMRQLRVGMKETEAVSLMQPVSKDSGRVYYGGTGSRRLYFQCSPTLQLWLEVSGSPDWTITEIGVPEPKTKWTRYDGDSITVE